MTLSARWTVIASCAGIFALLSAFAPPGVEGLCDSPVVGGHTGAPGETSCAGCHAGTLNSGSAVIEWNVGDAGTYVPGTQYTGTVSIKRPGREKFGFSCLALQNSGNVNLGGFGLVETVRTRTYVDGSRNYVSHTPCGADAQDSTGWTFTWQAPATDVGPITIYMGSLVANHNHNTSGDESYTRSITLVAAGVGINENGDGGIGLRAFPNPTTGIFRLRDDALGGRTSGIEVIDASGKVVRRLSSVPARTQDIDLSDQPNGVYLIRSVGDNIARPLHLVKQH